MHGSTGGCDSERSFADEESTEEYTMGFLGDDVGSIDFNIDGKGGRDGHHHQKGSEHVSI
jgi:hypothetical protein